MEDHTVAIAGCCGYIGTHMTRAALGLGMRVYGLDPEIRDQFREHPRFKEADDLASFCELPADLFYLALQPHHRPPYLDRLIPSGRSILSEKPMARARDPETCDAIARALTQTPARMRYNFLLLYNPITGLIRRFLRSKKTARIQRMAIVLEKNRESLRNPRNTKYMEPIQYQESIHGLALMLALRGESDGFSVSDFDAVFPGGLRAKGDSAYYDAPSPVFDVLPDGAFSGALMCSGFQMDIRVNFKRLDHRFFPTHPQKFLALFGEADGASFSIEADYQRGREMLRINGARIPLPPFDPYAYIWKTVLGNADCSRIPADEHLARLTYRLSAMLWCASFTGQEQAADSHADLAEIALGYRAALTAGRLPTYRHRPVFEWAKKHLIDPVIDSGERLRGRWGRPNHG